MKHISKFVYLVLMVTCISIVMQIMLPSQAYAHGCQCAPKIASEHRATRKHFDTLLDKHQNDFLIKNFWETIVQPSLEDAVKEVSAVIAGNTQAIGTFMDVAQNLETQRARQVRSAEMATELLPSEASCEVATAMGGIAEATVRAKQMARIMQVKHDQRAGKVEGTPGATGPIEDINGRFDATCPYVDPRDQNGGMGITCGPDAGSSGLVNADINVRDVMGLTIKGFNPDDPDNDAARAIELMQTNLFGSTQMPPVSADLMEDFEGRELVLQIRALRAKRLAAVNSFNEIIAMRAEGGPESAGIVPHLLEHAAGIKNPQIAVRQVQEYGTRPSYLAQMGILSKLVATDPETVVKLISTGENVARTNAMFNAVNNWISFELLQSAHRREMIMAGIYEMHIADEEQGIQVRQNNIMRSAALRDGLDAARLANATQ